MASAIDIALVSEKRSTHTQEEAEPKFLVTPGN